jgi:hypothetical protein
VDGDDDDKLVDLEEVDREGRFGPVVFVATVCV